MFVARYNQKDAVSAQDLVMGHFGVQRANGFLQAGGANRDVGKAKIVREPPITQQLGGGGDNVFDDVCVRKAV